MSKLKKTLTPMEKLTQGYEKFMESQELKNNGKALFDKTIKKAARIVKKGRGTK